MMWIDVAAEVIERFGTNTSGNLYFDRVKWCLKCFFDTKSTKKGLVVIKIPREVSLWRIGDLHLLYVNYTAGK